jgi:hypothetical protein
VRVHSATTPLRGAAVIHRCPFHLWTNGRVRSVEIGSRRTKRLPPASMAASCRSVSGRAPRTSGLPQDAVDLRTAHRTRALRHPASRLAHPDLAGEVTLLLALHAVGLARICLGHLGVLLHLVAHPRRETPAAFRHMPRARSGATIRQRACAGRQPRQLVYQRASGLCWLWTSVGAPSPRRRNGVLRFAPHLTIRVRPMPRGPHRLGRHVSLPP